MEYAARIKTTIDGEEAGLCARLDEHAHYEICLTQKDGQSVIAAYLTVDGITQLAGEVPTTAQQVFLKIHAEVREYSLLYSLEGEDWINLATGAAYSLSPQAVKGNSFTGVVVGIYATGQGKIAQVPAYFDWFDYTSFAREIIK